MSRPNILFLFSDQQRWDTVNCYGNAIHDGITPNLDKLAAQGVRFQHAFTCQPVCGPARACLQTGQYATQIGCPTNGFALPMDADTVAKRVHHAGYETGYIGKWHLASDNNVQPEEKRTNYRMKAVPPELRGGYQDHWLVADALEHTSHGYEGYMFDADMNRVDFEGYRVDCTANFVIDYLRDYGSRKPERPFFLFTSFIEPHHQNDLGRYIGPIGSKQRFAGYRTPGDLEGLDGNWREELPDYLGCCWSLDRNVGRIVDELELQGLLDNTIIIYTSDHGSHFCTRNSEYKRSCHEGSLRVPLIIRGPGFEGGKVVEDLVSLIDLPSTVVTAAGGTVMARNQGRPLQELVEGATDWTDHVFAQISESHCGRCIRTRKWKFSVRAVDPVRTHYGTRYVHDFLYDLEQDPHERNNMIADPDYAAVRQELGDLLKTRIQQIENLEVELLEAGLD